METRCSSSIKTRQALSRSHDHSILSDSFFPPPHRLPDPSTASVEIDYLENEVVVLLTAPHWSLNALEIDADLS